MTFDVQVDYMDSRGVVFESYTSRLQVWKEKDGWILFISFNTCYFFKV